MRHEACVCFHLWNMLYANYNTLWGAENNGVIYFLIGRHIRPENAL